jgi:hypothetical protein
LDTKKLIDAGRINEYTFSTDRYHFGYSGVDCRPLILEEIEHRKKRIVFDNFITHHIDYPSYKLAIYSTCYPTDILVAAPSIGWKLAEEIRNKYFFDEIFFILHLHVANLLSRKEPHRSTTANASSTTITSTAETTTIKTLLTSSTSITELANNNNDTSLLMNLLTDRLKEYLKPAPL